MKKLIIFLILGIFGMQSYCSAQQVRLNIDYPTIKEFVTSHHEDYQNLVQRFEKNDSLLTRDDYAMIYFGYSFTPDYTGSMFDMTNEFQKFRELGKEGKYKKALKEGEKLLKKNPVSLELLFRMGMFANESKEDIQTIKSYSKRYAALLTMIAFTGDGKTEESAFKVICVNDEYQLLNMLFVMENMKSQSLINKCDLIEFEKCKYYRGTKMYFDISRSLEKMSETIRK